MPNFEDVRKRLLARALPGDLGAGATQEEIAEAEKRLGIHIAGDYRDFVESLGWGGADDFEIYGLGADVPDHLDLCAMTESERTVANPPLPANLLPLLNDGGGNLYCIDLLAGEDVVIWDHERSSDQTPERVAPNFSALLQQLLDD